MGFKDIKYHMLTCNVCHMIIISGREVQYDGFRLLGWRILQQPTLRAGFGLKKELMWLKQAMSAGQLEF